MTPNPTAAPKKRPLGFWLAIGGGSLLGCCLLTAVCGALGNSQQGSNAGTTVAAAGDNAAAAPSAGTSDGADIIYHAPNGQIWNTQLTLVGDQVLSGTQLIGAWTDENHGFGMRLDADGQYEIRYHTYGGGVAISADERGSWSLQQGAFTLSPSSLEQRGINGAMGHLPEDNSNGGPPRVGRLDGVLLEYQPFGVEPKTTRRIDGVRLTGPVPPWYGSYAMNIVLHRAPEIP